MLNEYSIDLHMHSMLSDGKETPVEVINKAASAGLKKIILCDHNVLHPSFEKLREYAATKGVELPFMGCEATVVYYKRNFPFAVFHMLVYGEEQVIKSPEFIDAVCHVDDQRNITALRQLRRLVAAGAPVTFEEAFIFDKDIAPMEKSAKYSETQVMKTVAKNLGITTEEAEARYADCAEDYSFSKKGWLRQLASMADAEELVRLARKLGLVTVIAHPSWIERAFQPLTTIPFEEKAEMIRDLREAGLDGLETCHEIVAEDNEREIYESLAAELGLITTGGSDYHAEPDYGRHLTEYGVTEEQFAVLAELVHSRAAK